MTKKIEYIKIGDYYYPNLKVDKVLDCRKPIGKYGRMRLNYLKQNERAHYNALLMKNELYNHLVEIEQQAYELHDRLLEQYKIKWGITEQLKEENQIRWVSQMNNIENYIFEIIKDKIIYC